HAASVRPEPGSNSPTKTGPTIAPRTGPRRLNVQTGTKPVHEQARHTVEFSRDTRTPSSAVRRPSAAVPPLYTPRAGWIRGVPVRGAVSGPCDRGSQAFVLSGVSLTKRKLREGFRASQIAPLIPPLTSPNKPSDVTRRACRAR